MLINIDSVQLEHQSQSDKQKATQIKDDTIRILTIAILLLT